MNYFLVLLCNRFSVYSTLNYFFCIWWICLLGQERVMYICMFLLVLTRDAILKIKLTDHLHIEVKKIFSTTKNIIRNQSIYTIELFFIQHKMWRWKVKTLIFQDLTQKLLLAWNGYGILKYQIEKWVIGNNLWSLSEFIVHVHCEKHSFQVNVYMYRAGMIDLQCFFDGLFSISAYC